VGQGALGHIRICDFTGQLAGAGATKYLAAFGAEVIRIEDPVTGGRWDILRGAPPFKDERRGPEFGSGFNNHNVDKLGITLNLRTERGKELLAELVRRSDAVTENFAAGVLERWGFGFERLRELRPDVVYVSNCGFGQVGPYGRYKSWGPIAQAVCGLTFTSGLPDLPPAGWGYSYMDHTGGYYMAIAILAALFWRARTGEGQWVDLSCTEAGAALHGPAVLDAAVNGRPMRRPGSPHANRNAWPAMAPHGVYPTAGDDNWVAVSVVDDEQWAAFAAVVDEHWAAEDRWRSRAGRLAALDELDGLVGAWTAGRDRYAVAETLRARGVAAAPVQRPAERIDGDPATAAWGLWPTVQHDAMGEVRVDGLPVHLSETDWAITRGGPTLGRDNEQVYGGLLGLSGTEIGRLRDEGVI
jgi:crotonobetainyl-CoA:carnitine CoA-transferase CaiB-like acyl-CoA transferase